MTDSITSKPMDVAEAIRCLRLKLSLRKQRIWSPGMSFSAEIQEVETLIAALEQPPVETREHAPSCAMSRYVVKCTCQPQTTGGVVTFESAFYEGYNARHHGPMDWEDDPGPDGFTEHMRKAWDTSLAKRFSTAPTTPANTSRPPCRICDELGPDSLPVLCDTHEAEFQQWRARKASGACPKCHGQGFTMGTNANDETAYPCDCIAPTTRCDHNWVSMRNEVIESGEFCPKCRAMRAETTTHGLAPGLRPCDCTDRCLHPGYSPDGKTAPPQGVVCRERSALPRLAEGPLDQTTRGDE